MKRAFAKMCQSLVEGMVMLRCNNLHLKSETPETLQDLLITFQAFVRGVDQSLGQSQVQHQEHPRRAKNKMHAVRFFPLSILFLHQMVSSVNLLYMADECKFAPDTCVAQEVGVEQS